MNQLIYRVCADVLATAAQLPASSQLGPSTELRQQLIAALDKLISRGRRVGIPDADLAEARYALVALLDEQVLKATWSGRAEWMNRPLQLDLYRENNAGEDFFVRLSALLRNGRRPLAVQVYYLCLALGFQGTYAASRDTKALAKFISAARQQLSAVLPAPDNSSPHGSPRRVAKAEIRGRGGLLGASVGGVLVVVLVILVAGWFVERELHAAVSELSAASTTLPRLAQ